MKHSIKRQMTGGFIGLIICMLLLMLIVNVNFLEPYYVRDKQAKFITMYERLKEAVTEDSLQDDDTVKELFQMAAENNMFFLVANTTEQKAYANVPDTEDLTQQLYEFLLNQSPKKDVILKLTDDYEISQSRGRSGTTENLRMRGSLGNGYYVVISSPLESIQASVQLSNRFLIYVGSIMIVVCSLLVWFFSKWLTDPIL